MRLSRMLRMLGWTGAAGACLAIAACGYWRDQFLDAGKNKVTQTQVQEKFGKPHTVKESLLGGESVWTYRFVLTDSEKDPYNLNSFVRPALNLSQQAAAMLGKGGQVEQKGEGLHCVRYILTFTPDDILKNWRSEACDAPGKDRP